MTAAAPAEPVLTKTLRDGRTATVTIIEEGPGCPYPFTVARASDGEELGSHVGPHHVAARAPDGHVAAIGRLLLTAEEAAQVEVAYQEVCAARPPNLRRQREDLVAAVAGWEEKWADDRAAAHDAGAVNPFAADAGNERLIKQARGDLAAFDAAHPEVAAAVRAEQEAAARQRAQG